MQSHLNWCGLVAECKKKNITKIDVLGFDYEMGLDFGEYKSQGIDIAFTLFRGKFLIKRRLKDR